MPDHGLECLGVRGDVGRIVLGFPGFSLELGGKAHAGEKA